MNPDIRDQALGRWSGLLPHLGVPAACLTGKHMACPMCGGKDRFRFDDKEGKGTYFCSGCGAGDGIKLVMQMNKWDFKTAAGEIRKHVGDAPVGKVKQGLSPDTCTRMVRKLWEASVPIGNDEAAIYLGKRGFPAPYSKELRFAPEAPVKDHPARLFHMPALIARIRDADGKAVSVHRTFLERGEKAKSIEARQLMPGPLPKGCAIRLAKVGEKGILGVAEGLETALAVMRDFLIPCWSTINSTMLAEFVPPPGLKELHIFADADLKYGGQAAAFKLAHRLATKPDAPHIDVKLPPDLGTDWDDAGKRRRRAA